MQEVIRIEPRAADAWSVLAQCYADKGERDRAVQLRIMKAHLTRDSEEWEDLAVQSKCVLLIDSRSWEVLTAILTREMGHHQQALYCYRKVYSLNPDNVDALWDRATLAKEIGDMQTVSKWNLFSMVALFISLTEYIIDSSLITCHPQTTSPRSSCSIRAAAYPHRPKRSHHLRQPLLRRIHPLLCPLFRSTTQHSTTRIRAHGTSRPRRLTQHAR